MTSQVPLLSCAGREEALCILADGTAPVDPAKEKVELFLRLFKLSRLYSFQAKRRLVMAMALCGSFMLVRCSIELVAPDHLTWNRLNSLVATSRTASPL